VRNVNGATPAGRLRQVTAAGGDVACSDVCVVRDVTALLWCDSEGGLELVKKGVRERAERITLSSGRRVEGSGADEEWVSRKRRREAKTPISRTIE
jgi:hypothetical protein